VAEIEKQFTRLDAGVTALRRVQANLKRYRAAVLKAACEGHLVTTEAERLKAEGRGLKNFESGEQLLKRILTERRQNWQGRGKYKEPATPNTTNLPPLPEGWTWSSLEQIALSSSYGTSAKCSPDNSGPPVLRIPNIAGGRIDLTDLKFAGADESIETEDELAPGDLLIIRTNGSKNLIGRSAVVREKLSRATSYASYLIRFRLFGSPALFDWVGIIWDVPFLRAWIEQRAATSAGQHNISMSVLSTMPIPIPPLAEQTRIVADVERRWSVVEELESVVTANLQRATRLRQSILHKAFSGKLVATMPAIQISDIIPPLKPEHIQQPNSHFARALLSAEIVHRLYIEPTFGRIKHQKIFHLCEHIAQITEIHGQYHREAAGPLDNKLIYANEAELKKQKWYQEAARIIRPRLPSLGQGGRTQKICGALLGGQITDHRETHRTHAEMGYGTMRDFLHGLCRLERPDFVG
jgi:type I restriction enzyme S subunit